MQATIKGTTLTEAQWARQVDDLANMNDWLAYGVTNSTREITRRGGARVRVRNVNAGGVGFPDRVFVRIRHHSSRLLFVEYKRGKRNRSGGAGGGTYELTDEQVGWITRLQCVAKPIQAAAAMLAQQKPKVVVMGEPLPTVEVYVWRPEDLDDVVRVLS